MPVDYDSLAQQSGGSPVPVDYDSLAQQHGGSSAAQDPFGTMTPEQYSKLDPGEQHFRQGFAQFAKDHPHIFSVIKSAYMTPPAPMEMSIPGTASSIPARDLLDATSAFFKAGGKDMAAGAGKAATGAVLSRMGPLGEFGNAMAGGGLFTEGARQVGRGIKAGFQAGREAFSVPEAEALDTSALPVNPAPAAAEPPIEPYPEGVGIHGGVEGQPIPGHMDDVLASMKKRLGLRDVPSNQDRYDIGSGAPVMKAKASKAAANDTSLEDQLAASVKQAKAGKSSAAQTAPASDNYKPGDTVWLPNRGHVLITKINGDGTFDYTMSK